MGEQFGKALSVELDFAPATSELRSQATHWVTFPFEARGGRCPARRGTLEVGVRQVDGLVEYFTVNWDCLTDYDDASPGPAEQVLAAVEQELGLAVTGGEVRRVASPASRGDGLREVMVRVDAGAVHDSAHGVRSPRSLLIDLLPDPLVVVRYSNGFHPLPSSAP